MDLEEKRNVLRKWISDAVADGWSLQPTYGPDEPVEFAGTLTRVPAEDECVGAQRLTTWVVSYLDRPGKHAFRCEHQRVGPRSPQCRRAASLQHEVAA